ncbi:MAG: tetratricopeptide repeat protein [Cyanobacteria bacterium SZAS TMP-1]|nr:tetratricopeptide repeat protein [Cyanobacteria bacterium SZAS TMP-1]
MRAKRPDGTITAVALSLALLGPATGIWTLAANAADDPGCRGCLQSASGLFARGDNAGAAKLLSQWQAKCPGNLQLALMLNTVLMRMPDGKKKALEAAEAACAIAPNSMLAHFQKAMTLMTLQDGPGAAKEFKRVVELDPTSHESWLALSELLGAQGDIAGAKDAENHAAQLSPSARQAQLSSLASKDRAGNAQGFKQEVSRIIDNPANSAETMLIVGEEVMKYGYFDEAAQCFARAQSKYPDAPQIKVLLPYVLLEAGKYSDSARLLSGGGGSKGKGTTGGASVNAPQEAIAGMANLGQGNFEAGQKTIENLVAAGDNQSIISMALGHLAMRQGQYKAAIEKFSDAAAKNKNLSVVKFYLALANLEAGDLKEGIAQARESQQKASGMKVKATAIELMARLRDGEDNGSNIAALKSELAALTKLSSVDQALSGCALAEAALKEGDAGRARELYSAALTQMPGCMEAHVGLGRTALAENNDKAAIAEFDKALALAPGYSQALAYKALALISSGDAGGAEALLNKVKEESEINAQLALALGKAYQKAGQEKDAARYFGQAIQAGATGPALQQAKDGLKASGAPPAKAH